MSNPKLISPLLDGFSMGNPVSSHDGVICCPALKENSDQRYIVKIISIPASQRQLDALLLTGAYQDPAAAMEYFKQLSQEVADEAAFLLKLSQMDGFLPYEGWQVAPMEDGRLGYQVYLLGTYKRTLERHMRKNLLSHLEAVNLGLDICSALSTCRRAGRMYVDLRPGNIFISSEKAYRIGDLGFVALDSLKYASLPSKYISPYTAPELTDPLSGLNATADTYALGMLLYQVYNDGKLPTEDLSKAEHFPAPANADYEISEILQKALAPNPADRWQDPAKMGQALVAYMQRNSVNDTPIAPPAFSLDEAIPTEMPPIIVSDAPADAENSEELEFLQEMVSDDTAPGEEDAALAPEVMSAELSSMLAQADNLMSKTDAAPDISVPDGDTAVAAAVSETVDAVYADSTEPQPPKKAGLLTALLGRKTEREDDEEEFEDDEPVQESVPRSGSVSGKPRNARAAVGILVTLLVLILLAGGAYYFYQNYYLLPIDGLEIQTTQDQATVLVDTLADESLLSVAYTDTYGNYLSMPVKDGKVVFGDLKPDTSYRVEVSVEGFHKLTGSVSAQFTTPAQTEIVSFTAITGAEDGSVVLSFTVEGPEKSPDWTVYYAAEGEEEKSLAFSGHTVNVKDLTVGKTYTFRLEPAEGLYLTGENTLEFEASQIIIAQNLHVVSCVDGNLTVQWEAPEGIAVENWSVRCYSDETDAVNTTTSENTATFSGIDPAKAYTVEVTAAGMTQPARTGITANPITINTVKVDDTDPQKLTVSWDFAGKAPQGGWLMMYTVDNSEAPEVVKCETNSGIIATRIPGAAYHLVIQAADGSTVFNSNHTYNCPHAAPFDLHSLSGDRVSASLCKTPEKANWTFKDIRQGDYTSTFLSGAPISVVLQATGRFYLDRDNTTILFVIRDENGNVVPSLTAKETWSWYDMWWNTDYHYCELNLPQVPTAPGKYTLSIYFNGGAATAIEFFITQ